MEKLEAEASASDLQLEVQHRFDERLALLGAYGEPTYSQWKLAMADVQRFVAAVGAAVAGADGTRSHAGTHAN